MKRLLNIKFSRETRFKVRVRAVKLPARPGLPARPFVLVILPGGKVVPLPEPHPLISNRRPRRGLSALAVTPPLQPRPLAARSRAGRAAATASLVDLEMASRSRR